MNFSLNVTEFEQRCCLVKTGAEKEFKRAPVKDTHARTILQHRGSRLVGYTDRIKKVGIADPQHKIGREAVSGYV